LWQELTREQHVVNQERDQRRLRIDHVNNSVKRCRSVKDRSRLWQAGVRDLVTDICCALHHAGFVFPVAAYDLIGINSNVLRLNIGIPPVVTQCGGLASSARRQVSPQPQMPGASARRHRDGVPLRVGPALRSPLDQWLRRSGRV